jgi:endogenous inhibitor of DNA gyrase (YacG/DUF329 family)
LRLFQLRRGSRGVPNPLHQSPPRGFFRPGDCQQGNTIGCAGRRVVSRFWSSQEAGCIVGTHTFPRASSYTLALSSRKRQVGNTMPRWVLYCPRCKKAVPHSEVTFRRAREEEGFAWVGRKPDFPSGGLSLECPHCKETSVYQPHELVYSAT